MSLPPPVPPEVDEVLLRAVTRFDPGDMKCNGDVGREEGALSEDAVDKDDLVCSGIDATDDRVGGREG